MYITEKSSKSLIKMNEKASVALAKADYLILGSSDWEFIEAFVDLADSLVIIPPRYNQLSVIEQAILKEKCTDVGISLHIPHKHRLKENSGNYFSQDLFESSFRMLDKSERACLEATAIATADHVVESGATVLAIADYAMLLLVAAARPLKLKVIETICRPYR